MVRCTEKCQLLQPTAHISRRKEFAKNQNPPWIIVGSQGIGDAAFPHPNMYASVSAKRRAIAQRIHQGLTQGGTATATSTRAAHTTGTTTPQIKSDSR